MDNNLDSETLEAWISSIPTGISVTDILCHYHIATTNKNKLILVSKLKFNPRLTQNYRFCPKQNLIEVFFQAPP